MELPRDPEILVDYAAVAAVTTRLRALHDELHELAAWGHPDTGATPDTPPAGMPGSLGTLKWASRHLGDRLELLADRLQGVSVRFEIADARAGDWLRKVLG